MSLARAAAKAFGDGNAVVDVNHAVRRLADVKTRYGMSDTGLEQYVRTAPDQPGLLRAGFPFGAAFSPSRLVPWLEKKRHRRVRSEPRDDSVHRRLPVQELAIRGSAFLDSLRSRTRCAG